MRYLNKSYLAFSVILLVLIYFLFPILCPFLLGLLLAYLTQPGVAWLTRHRWPRSAAAAAAVLSLILIVVILGFLLIPPLQNQFNLLIGKLPTFISWLKSVVFPWLQAHLPFTAKLDLHQLKQTALSKLPQAGNFGVSTLKTISSSSFALLGFAIEVLIIPISMFYFLKDWPGLCKQICALIPAQTLPTLKNLFKECDCVVKAFFRGQSLVILVLAIFYSIGFKLIGFEVSLLLGILVACLSIIPYLGSIIGLLSITVTAIIQFGDVSHLWWVLLVFALGHILENFLLAPLLIGGRIGVHPLAVIFFILAGGKLFGILGVILALPAAAVLMVILRYWRYQYLINITQSDVKSC